MLVIPAINCKDRDSALKQIKKADSFFSASGWVHIDVVDGEFANVVTWGSPGEVIELTHKYSHINFEIHLMVAHPEVVLKSWLKSGAKRLIFHIESLRDPVRVAALCKKHGVEAMLACGVRTPAEWLKKYFGIFDSFQFLAVEPGFAGQKFDVSALKKIKFLRGEQRHVKIEVDGGVEPEVAKLAKDAGADIAVSASYIFKSRSPQRAYNELTRI
ncbi:MAG: hypothetical protein HYS87_00975 [Candidatus Colwellbacteria bacterium]|nr:hypothetical protein [Candidatus Colwellbacteria bacterium]